MRRIAFDLPRGLGLGTLSLALGLFVLALGASVHTARRADAAPPTGGAPVARPADQAEDLRLLHEVSALRGLGDFNALPGRRPGFADVVAPALAAVVNIQSTQVVNAADRRGGNDEDAVPWPFHDFFPFPPNGRFHGGRAPEAETFGSGVIVRSDGIILTNNHVVDGAKQLKVTLSDKRELTAKVIGTDPKTDIAVLRIEASGLPAVRLGTSSDLRVGDLVFAVGNPFEVGQSVTMGIVSATGRTRLGIVDGGTGYENFIQTDAAINPGNSGGALIDGRGDLVGVNTAIETRGSGGNQGVGFAVPIEMASRVMDQILKSGKVTRAQIGVRIGAVTPALQRVMHLQGTNGAVVARVLPDSPGEKAGLKEYDVITELDGSAVTDSDQFRLDVASRKPGDRVRLGLLRDGAHRDVEVTLGEMTEEAAAPEAEEHAAKEAETSRWGVGVSNVTPQLRSELNLDDKASGVVVTSVDPGTPAARAGMQPGDLVAQVNRHAVHTTAEFKAQVKAAGSDGLLLLIERDAQQVLLPLEP